MKATELMIGDWVAQKHSGLLLKVSEVRPPYILADGEGSQFHEDTLEPIPLTAKILEKNGFVTKDKPDHWTGYRYYEYKKGSTVISFKLYHDTGKYKWSGTCEISLNSAPYWIRFKYLHELQNILKICGIECPVFAKIAEKRQHTPGTAVV